jgi:hypothetical protein
MTVIDFVVDLHFMWVHCRSELMFFVGNVIQKEKHLFTQLIFRIFKDFSFSVTLLDFWISSNNNCVCISVGNFHSFLSLLEIFTYISFLFHISTVQLLSTQKEKYTLSKGSDDSSRLAEREKMSHNHHQRVIRRRDSKSRSKMWVRWFKCDSYTVDYTKWTS